MNRIYILWLVSAIWLLIPVSYAKNSDSSPREREKFNSDWRFAAGDYPEAASADYDDTAWRALKLPHDWSIEGKFSREHPAGPGGGALPGGIGWYRKTFVIDGKEKNKRIFIDFDGVYMNSEVFINGHSLGVRPFGYISFRYDLTPFIRFGATNAIAVKVDNSMQPNSRWYSGSGIYRNVWLTKVNPVHVELWGTYIVTPKVTDQQAIFKIETAVANTGRESVKAEVRTALLDEKGKNKAANTSEISIPAGRNNTALLYLTLENPVRWSIDQPYLYTVHTEIRVNGELVDSYDTTTGVRTFRFDAEKGFFLNEKPLKIKGVCQHHDLGCLGTAIHVRALERQLEILKKMGCNSIRCSHNPPAPELLDLCDKMGFIVMDEAFDIWRKKKTAYDYSLYFNEWHERDLTDLILRDRNHPSVMVWSIGNEVLEQWTHADADTLSIQEANLILNAKRDESALSYDGETLSVNSLLTQKLAQVVRHLDPTRPITTGNNEARPENHLYRANTLDIIGYNYQDGWFKKVPENFPGMPFIITESTSALMTRGYYRMPSDSMFIWPERWDKPFYDPSMSCSAYDNCHVPWGTTHEKSWSYVKNNDFISGLYVWTGFDYIGEPTPYDWPARSSYFGIIDLAGFPKDVYYMYQSEWTDTPVLHLFPHWNHKPGEQIDLWAYYNHADEVELFVNGESKGVKRKEGENFHVCWRVNFEPGTVKVISKKEGKEVMIKEIRTAGKPAHIRLTADRSHIAANGEDLSFITIDVIDASGNLCPHADNLMHFEVVGNAFIAGVDNGNQTSTESFKAPYRKAFNGKCLVVLQNNGEKGEATLTASSEGLPNQSITINMN